MDPPSTAAPLETLTAIDEHRMAELTRTDRFFWLDLLEPSQAEVDRLAEAIGLDPMAAERALKFDEVPQLRRFRGHVGLIFFGAEVSATEPPELVEVHIFVSGDWVITVRRRPSRALDLLREEVNRAPPAEAGSVVARILGALTETFEDLLDPIDERIEHLEAAVAGDQEVHQPYASLRAQILDHRGRLRQWRRLMRRQRDHIEVALTELSSLPGLQHSQGHELGDVATQVILVNDQFDDALDGLARALELLNSTQASEMNVVMERLTVVATVFLPLTVVTGFFGQNFGWMTARIDSLTAFLLGLGFFVASGWAIWWWARARLERRLALERSSRHGRPDG